MEKCWVCSEGRWGTFSAWAVWWTCFTTPLSVQLTSGHAELCGFCFPLGSGHYSTRCLETLHHIPFNSTLTQYPTRPRSVFVCVAEGGQAGIFSAVVVVVMLSGVSEWGWEATAPQSKSCMIVWIIPTRKKKQKKHAPLTFRCGAHEQPCITSFWIWPSQ